MIYGTEEWDPKCYQKFKSRFKEFEILYDKNITAKDKKPTNIDNVVFINQMKTPYPEKVQSKIKEYGMELWDLDKLITMSKVNKIYIQINKSIIYFKNKLCI